MSFKPLFNVFAIGGMDCNSPRQSFFKYPLHHWTTVFPYSNNHRFPMYFSFPKTKLPILKKVRHWFNFKLVKPRRLNHYSVYEFARTINRRNTVIFDNCAIIMDSRRAVLKNVITNNYYGYQPCYFNFPIHKRYYKL